MTPEGESDEVDKSKDLEEHHGLVCLTEVRDGSNECPCETHKIDMQTRAQLYSTTFFKESTEDTYHVSSSERWQKKFQFLVTKIARKMFTYGRPPVHTVRTLNNFNP